MLYNRHVYTGRGKLRRFHPHTKNHGQLRNAESRNILPQGGARELII